MNGHEHSLESLAVQAVAIGAMPASAIRDAALNRVLEAAEATDASVPNRDICMNEAETALTLLALRRYIGSEIMEGSE